MSATTEYYEVRFDQVGELAVDIYGVRSDGQRYLVASTFFGPFDTALEIAQWAWRLLTIDITRSNLLR